MSVKAKLKIVLQADDTVVAESDDALLWQRILVAMNQGGASQLSPAASTSEDVLGGHGGSDLGSTSDDPVAKFARQIGVLRVDVEGACSPSMESPYMHLDSHCWEDMKRQTGERGPNAVSPIALALTLLALWFREANLGNPTQAQAQEVLRTINLSDKNASRGVQRADWLQSRSGGVVVLNPAKISKAKALAKSFCTKQWKVRGEE